MSSNSNASNASAHEAGDQRDHPDSQKQEEHAVPYEEGKENSHQENDPSMFPTLLGHELLDRQSSLILIG